jgi:hypothetical protein
VAGTQLQEIGHDAVIVAFIQKVLSGLYNRAIYLVNPAMGPKRDIYFPDATGSNYLSAYSLAGPNYIPAFQYRFQIPAEDMARLETASGYRLEEWYLHLSRLIGSDLSSHLSAVCERLETALRSDLPDILAIDNAGRLVAIAEVKFEGFSPKARDSVLEEYGLARDARIPYYLAIPKYPSYSREISDASITRNLPPDLTVYKFEVPKGSVLPRQDQIRFVRVESQIPAAKTPALRVGS